MHTGKKETDMEEFPGQDEAHDMVVAGNTSLSVDVSSFAGFDGFGDVSSSDVMVGRVKLMQPMSPEVMAEGSTVKPGDIIDNITNTVLPAQFVPLKKLKNQHLLYNGGDKKDAFFMAEHEPEALITSETDPTKLEAYQQFVKGDAKMTEWTKDEEGKSIAPIARESMSFLCLFEGQSQPKIVSFYKTNFKVGRQFFNMMLQYKGKEPMFARKYALCAKKEKATIKGKEATFFVYDIKPVAKLDNAAEIHDVITCAQMYRDFDPSDMARK